MRLIVKALSSICVFSFLLAQSSAFAMLPSHVGNRGDGVSVPSGISPVSVHSSSSSSFGNAGGLMEMSVNVPLGISLGSSLSVATSSPSSFSSSTSSSSASFGLVSISKAEAKDPVEASFSSLTKEEAEAWLLRYAADGDVEGVQRLIKKGVDVNARQEYCLTALMWAVRGRHEEVVRLLLEAGADENKADEKGRTALGMAETAGYAPVIQLFLTPQLIQAVRQDDIAAIQDLILKGANVNAFVPNVWATLENFSVTPQV